MYGRLTSSVFASSTTFRIYTDTCQHLNNSGAPCDGAITYLDGSETRSVSGGHVLIESLDRVGPGHFPVLLVHVVRAGPRVVPKPDSNVLDLQGALLMDLRYPLMRCAYDKGQVPGHTTLRLTISPLAFFTFRSFVRKYQNRDFATTSLGAKIRIRYSLGVGLVSVGR